ncbi:LysR family transcriptional regulator [Paraburkholderia sp. 5N]|uniref:LysR family transcriptional regulator n=2 Tax=Paraburkholderia elongata TaxID=2675747 RepID=A0A972P150_9BURK|nr:LysR family transcriptional regulator [Paraburkholderia elongata]
METDMIDLRRVRYFVTAAEYLHFGRAAERMNVVQPAISQQIKRFEEELGSKLFERTGNEVRLTEVGQQMLPECRRLLEQADEAMSVARAARTGIRGRISFAFVDNAVCSLLPPLIRSYRERYPNVELRLQTLNREEQVTALNDRRIDIGLLPGPIICEDLESDTFASGPLVAALPRSHPLASRSSVPLEAFRNEPFVLFPAKIKSRLLEIIVAACANAGFTPRVVQEAIHIHTILALVDAGVGITLVPPWVVREGVHDVSFVTLDTSTPTYDLKFAWRTDSSNVALGGLRAIARTTRAPEAPQIVQSLFVIEEL